MRSFYSNEDLIAYAKQQIIENNDLIKGFEIIAELLPIWNGKVVNKRIETAMDIALKASFDHAWARFELMNNYSRLNLTIRDHDSYTTPGLGTYSNTDYVEYQESAYMKDCDNVRLNAEKTIAAIMDQIEHIKEKSTQLQYEIDHIFEIELEFNAIKERIDSFNHRYSYLILNRYSFR